MPKVDISLKRSVAIQLYLKEGIADEDLLLRVWNLAQQKGKARGQNLFRAMLTAGLMALTENGQMPEEIVESLNLDMLVDKKIRRKRRIEEARNPQSAAQGHPPAGFGYPQPYPPQFVPQPYPAQPYYPPQVAPFSQHPQEGPYEAAPRVHDHTPQKIAEPHPAPARTNERPPQIAREDKRPISGEVAADETPMNNGNGETKGSDTKSFLDLM
ncbi:hypothetical protein [Rhizobium sp. MHM7A]|uniref:hypothetical protein n=1 Tax=Rhizobium sp. MHM7A TaxID=2583233 RepID=UPI001106C1C5|nr:hypothetical protein [Rhizobium sp. MHM7A]TLX16488.1 hypothetical protein FFR93_03895 [Rhizobium sp. MHM7A]